MKLKTILLTCALFGAVVSVNATGNNLNPEKKCGKKDDINGTVVNADSRKPLKDVSITAYNASKKEKTVYSDDNGNFVFDELKPGTYKFVFEKSGYRKVVREKVIARIDEAFQLKIEMLEDGDFEILPSPFHFN